MPEVLVKNLHSQRKVKLKTIKRLAEKILEGEKNNHNVNIILTDDKYITRLNREFLNKNETTDVLSFGMKEGKKLIPEADLLGEVYISLDRAEKQAKEYNQSLQKEVNLLVTHGLLHLLGYDHRGVDQKKRMKKKEERYLSSGGVIRFQGKSG
jgi:probable rRNA maturation factor